MTVKNDIIVTTTNLKLGVICGEKNIPCYIPGGKITDTNMLSGFITDDTLSKMSFDVCVFSPGAMDAAGGLGVSEYFANTTRIAVAKSEKSIYLCDVSKLDKRIFIEALNLENVDVFISDVSVSDKLRKKYPETEFVKI